MGSFESGLIVIGIRIWVNGVVAGTEALRHTGARHRHHRRKAQRKAQDTTGAGQHHVRTHPDGLRRCV